MANKTTKKIALGEDFGAVAITVNGRLIEVSANGSIEIKPANSNTITAIATTRNAYKIGDRLKEGKLTTVVFGFDKNKDPIRVPENIFIGNAKFHDQDIEIKSQNDKLGLRGQRRFTRLNDQECAQLAKAWDMVAPPTLQGSAAPWFWAKSDRDFYQGTIYRGGEPGGWPSGSHKGGLCPVPAALRGPV